MDPKSITAYFYLADTKDKQNRFSAAIEDYSKVVDMMSGFFSGLSKAEKARVFFARGSTFAKMERFENAISDFDNAINVKPAAAVDAYLFRASVRLITSCDLEKILEDYYSVIDIETLDHETRQIVYNEIAWILATAADDNIRNGKKALDCAQKSIDIEQNCINTDTMAIALAEIGNFEDAIKTHKQAIDICKSNNPELVPKVEEHLDNYKQGKKLRETCPGVDIELETFRNWQKGM